MAKSKNISLRFNEDDLKLAFLLSGINKPQKLVDLLISEYVKPLKPTLIELPKDYMKFEKISIVNKNGEVKPLVFNHESQNKFYTDNSEIEKQIEAVKTAKMPEGMSKKVWEFDQNKKLRLLFSQIK